MSSQRTVVIGIILLIIGLVLYGYFSCINVPYKDVPDDMVSWFHLHVVDYLKSGGDPRNDTHLRLIDGRNLYLSPIFIDMLILALNVSPWYVVLSMGILYVLLVFVSTYFISKNWVVAGLASVLFSTAPAFVYWFKYNVFGAYIGQALWLALFIIMGIGFSRRNIVLVVVSALIFSVLWIMWPGAWILMVLYSIYLSALYYKGSIFREALVAGTLLLLFSYPVNIVTGMFHVTVYHVFASVLLLVNLVVGFIEYRVITGAVPTFVRSVWRIVGAVIGYVIGAGVAFSLLDFMSRYGVYEDYYHMYNPVEDYGVLGILSLFGLILLIRSQILRDLRENLLGFVSVAGFITGLLAAYFDPTLSVFAISGIVPLIAYGLYDVVAFLVGSSGGRYRVVLCIVATWILIGSVVGNVIPANALSQGYPSVFYGDFTPRFLSDNTVINQSAFLTALDFIKMNSSGETVVIGYWGYSYWIVGYLGKDAYTFADIRGSDNGRRILSWTMLSDDDTSYALIKKYVPSNIKDIYLVVAEVVSIDESVKYAHLGRAIVLRQASGFTPAEVIFQPIGDIGRIPLYARVANESLSDYLDLTRANYFAEVPLAWTSKAVNSLCVKMLYFALRSKGYNVVNDVISSYPLQDIEPLRHIKLVDMTMQYLQDVDTGTNIYKVYYVVAIYKVVNE
ncbi:MAG: hypothetical protein J7L82_06795 [Staphylothermus sp.]|nr:hypothetical protein [Staphylothermus sp.]